MMTLLKCWNDIIKYISTCYTKKMKYGCIIVTTNTFFQAYTDNSVYHNMNRYIIFNVDNKTIDNILNNTNNILLRIIDYDCKIDIGKFEFQMKNYKPKEIVKDNIRFYEWKVVQNNNILIIRKNNNKAEIIFNYSR